MGRRKKRIKIRRKRTTGPYFQCPVCGSQTLSMRFERQEGKRVAIATCGTCGLRCVTEVPERAERIDVYNRISDMAYENRIEEICSTAQAQEVEEGAAEGMEEYVGEEEIE